jgi:alpha,alpha-trehalase
MNSLPPPKQTDQGPHPKHQPASRRDMPLRASPLVVASAFDRLDLQKQNEEDRATLLRGFISEWLDAAGSDLLPATAADEDDGATIALSPPGWISAVKDPGAREWAEHLRSMWPALTRRTAPTVAAHPDRHTLLWSDHPFVVPGQRFREAYYWDSLWVVKGLLACGGDAELALAKGVVDGLISLAERHGFVPNGLRSYYLNRSQPPLLAAMVSEVHAAAPDLGLLKRALGALRAEHAYWTSPPKLVAVSARPGRGKRRKEREESAPPHYLVSRYYASWDLPRPESCREDEATATAAGIFSPSSPCPLHRELASAAESGWDFSSRWLADGRTLSTAQTTRTVPADLAGMLLRMEVLVAGFAAELGEESVAEEFGGRAAARREAIRALHWDPGSGQWRDLILDDEATGAEGEESVATIARGWTLSPRVCASNWLPLAMGAEPAGSSIATRAVASLAASGLVQAGGVSASGEATGQQWDWPNAWPPLQCMLAEGCREYGGEEGEELAARIACSFLDSAYSAWRRTGKMFEKYDAVRPGTPGGGGEYACVEGFGWSNGAALALMAAGWAGKGEVVSLRS